MVICHNHRCVKAFSLQQLKFPYSLAWSVGRSVGPLPNHLSAHLLAKKAWLFCDWAAALHSTFFRGDLFFSPKQNFSLQKVKVTEQEEEGYNILLMDANNHLAYWSLQRKSPLIFHNLLIKSFFLSCNSFFYLGHIFVVPHERLLKKLFLFIIPMSKSFRIIFGQSAATILAKIVLNACQISASACKRFRILKYIHDSVNFVKV